MISPSSPYETRSPSSTCAGRPLPSRPATYLTSGAYVRMSRSRTPWSRVRANSRQRAVVSSAGATGERIRCPAAFSSSRPERTRREGGQPERERARGHGDHEQAGLVSDRGRAGLDGHAREGDREHEEERAERASLRGRGHGEDSSREAGRIPPAQGRSSAGRASVSKTEGR